MSDHDQEPPDDEPDHDQERDDDPEPIELCDDPKAARRARLAVARHFNGDAAKIRDAMLEYEGTYPTLEHYVRLEIEEHIAPYMQWLLDGFIDLVKIGRHWIELGRNWILLDVGRDAAIPRGVHVFLASPPTLEEQE